MRIPRPDESLTGLRGRPVEGPIPARIRFAVDLLDLGPNDEVLEIGCGPGHAVALVAERLPDGARLTAIDRSATMVARAQARNADALASGKVVMVRQSLEEAAAQGGAFDELFAINVNCFWTAPDGSIAALHRLGRPGACVTLVYEPPGRARLRELEAALPSALEAAGLRVTDVRGPSSPGALLLAVKARLPRSGSKRAR